MCNFFFYYILIFILIIFFVFSTGLTIYFFNGLNESSKIKLMPTDLSLVKLGKKKGYELVHCNEAGNNAFFVKKELLNDKIKSIDAVEGFVHNKFRESRNKEGKLTFLDKKSEEEILFKLPLEEV